MVFDYEYQMVEPAISWLYAKNYLVKQEFTTPWGVCDIVACIFNPCQIRKRLDLGQNKPIGSQFRAMMLTKIPDKEEGKPLALKEISARLNYLFDDSLLTQEIDRLIQDKFVERASSGAFHKLNGWVPLQKKLIAIELKLTRITEALSQAINNSAFADESYVGLPIEKAISLSQSPRGDAFMQNGIGLIGIDSDSCEVLIRPSEQKVNLNIALQTHCVERFWRTFPKDS